MDTIPIAALTPLPQSEGLSPARYRLFQVALTLFGERGYDGVSVRDISRELGQHPTAIYAHVSSKQELLYRLMRIGHEALRDELRAALLEAGTAPAAQVDALVRAHVRTHLTYPALARVINRNMAHLSPEQTEVIGLLVTDCGAMLRDVIARGIDRGDFQPLDTELAIRTIAVIGVAVADWWTPELGMTADHVVDVYAAYAQRMLT